MRKNLDATELLWNYTSAMLDNRDRSSDNDDHDEGRGVFR